ncbi:MAG: glycolate oxidase subunit GlcF [Ancalomicrobiaceae bacterium]|nr:glycolate oxidase subunit GlcF [Ancalomicrobiaceae bacterium]
MQTSFSLAQLADPAIAEADKILRNCVHCGFCTATCPTFLLLGDERDSPRGRIYLIKDMLENDRPADETVVTHIDHCLSCLACMTTCPSGVDYMHLVDHARVHIAETYRRPFADRLRRRILAAILPYPARLRPLLALGLVVRPLASLVRPLPGIGRSAASLLKLLPRRLPVRSAEARAGTHPAKGNRRLRVALLGGCASDVLGPQVNAAAVRLLTRLGVEVVRPKDEGCCGSLSHHMGDAAASHAAARRNIDIWWKETTAGGGAGLDAVVITASGCGVMVKDYGHLFRDDPGLAVKAAAIAALAKDISEVVAGLGPLPAAGTVPRLKVAYHGACALQHGQNIHALPMRLLAEAGFDVAPIPEGHICCGSAGTYNMLQTDLADALRARKVANIERLAPDVVAAGNMGCIAQIGSGTSIPVVHPVELIDWATGGEKPAGLC